MEQSAINSQHSAKPHSPQISLMNADKRKISREFRE